jgi:hypothetical protein
MQRLRQNPIAMSEISEMISQVPLFSDILNKSQVDANMKCWQICGNLNIVITSTNL